jgi:Spy/CpxP family protein refolding chaperone
MRSGKKILISMVLAATMLFAVTSTKAKDDKLISSLNLTKDQIGKIEEIIEEFSDKAHDIESKFDQAYLKLGQELKREDRFATESKARAGARNFNNLIRAASSLHGDLLKLKVAYLFKIKNVFTEEQKEMLFKAILDFETEVPDNFSFYLSMDVTSLSIGLTTDQLKRLIQYKAERNIKNIELEMEIDQRLVDLRSEIDREQRDPQKIDKIIMDIVDLIVQSMENHVNHVLKSKDVLTLEQKKELLHMMMGRIGH